jgi:putative ABC transport system permease protein
MRGARKSEIDAELALHIEMQAEQHLRDGHSPAEARRRALVDFGGVERFREATQDAHRSRSLDDFMRDLLHGARSLRRTPGHALITVLTLALGIGAATAMFSVLHGVLLRPLVYGDADRLYVLLEATESGGQRQTSYLSFRDWEEQATAFEAMAFIRGDEWRVRGEEGTQRLLAGYVSQGFFPTVQTQPVLGRTFVEGDADVVMLSYDLWQQRFAGDPHVLGTVVSTADGSYTVVGVMPPGFRLPQWADVWIPMAGIPADAAFALTRRDLRVDAEAWGLRRADVTEAAARADLGRIVAALTVAYPEAGGADWKTASLVPARNQIVGDIGEQLRIAAVAVALLLLIVCVNVAGLQLARGTARVRELAVRAALGASRGRLLRQLLTESVILAVAGGVLGLVIAAAAVNAMVARLPTLLPRSDEITLDVRVLAFAAAVALLTALLAGIVPALRSSAAGLTPSLRAGARADGVSRATRHMRSGLVVAQVALAIVLLVGAGLLLRSLWSLQDTQLGFATENRIALRVFPPASYESADAAATLYRRLHERVSSVPGVDAVALANHLPVAGGRMATRLETELAPPAEGQAVIIRTVSPEYFTVMGNRLLSGRLFEPADFDGGGGVVINSVTARDFFGTADPVGRSVTFYHSAQGRPDFGEPIRATIVGVVEAERFLGPEVNAPRALFVPWTQMVWPNISIVAHTSMPPERLLPDLRRAIRSVDQDIPVAGPGNQAQWRPLEAYAADALLRRRTVALLLTVFALSAVVLAALGLFGVMAWTVAQRTREIGVRTALGATRIHVAGLVAAQALRIACVGILLGVPASFATTRLLQNQLAGVSATDPSTLFAAASLFLVAAVASAAVPALRALRIPPGEALRAE